MTPNLEAICEAIATVEGFYVKSEHPTVSQRCNNPGNLMYVGQPGAVPYPVIGTDGKTRKYARFRSVVDGWGGLKRQVQLDASRGLTLAEFINKYAPASDLNNPTSYAATVAKRLNVAVTDKLSDVIA